MEAHQDLRPYKLITPSLVAWKHLTLEVYN